MARKQKDGGGKGIGEQFVPLVHSVRTSAAWADLSTTDRCLYIELRALVRPRCENNGDLFISGRDAARALNTGQRQARKAFYSLQAHGFAIVTQLGHLGAEGHGKATTYRLTCCACTKHPRGSRDYLQWQPDSNFPVVKGQPPKTESRVPRGRVPASPEAAFSKTLRPQRPRPASPEAAHVTQFRPEPASPEAAHLDIYHRGVPQSHQPEPEVRTFAEVRDGQVERFGVRSDRGRRAAA